MDMSNHNIINILFMHYERVSKIFQQDYKLYALGSDRIVSVWKVRDDHSEKEDTSTHADSVSFGDNDAIAKMFQISDNRKQNDIHYGNVKGKKSVFKFKKSKLKKIDKNERMKQIASVYGINNTNQSVLNSSKSDGSFLTNFNNKSPRDSLACTPTPSHKSKVSNNKDDLNANANANNPNDVSQVSINQYLTFATDTEQNKS